jgi:hypothetical protein
MEEPTNETDTKPGERVAASSKGVRTGASGARKKVVLPVPNAVAVEDLPKSKAHMGDMGAWILMLQDPGTANKRKGNTLEYKKINAWCRDFISRIKPCNIPGMPTNVTRGKEMALHLIVKMRKSVRTTTIYRELTQYIDDVDNKDDVYIIRNDVEFAGFNTLIVNLTAMFAQFVNRDVTKRTANDGLRVALLMQQSRHRDLVRSILQGKKGERQKADLSNNSDLAAYQALVEEFNDPSVLMPIPDSAEEIQDYESMDPNDVSTNLEIYGT